MPEPRRAAPRILSLLPSSTEISYRLGIGHQLVGVTFECDEPAFARSVHPVVVGGLHTAGLTPAQIDSLVRSCIAAGENLYTLDLEQLKGLAPDVILTQDLCRVCALPADNVTTALEALGCTAQVVTLDPHTLADVLTTITIIGSCCDAEGAAVEVVNSLQNRLDAVADAVANQKRPRVFVLEWTDPAFIAGHWVPELVTAAGGTAILACPGERSIAVGWNDIVAASPDVVVVAPCGFGLDDAVNQARTVLPRLPAGAQVWAIDANAYTVRPGPRLVDGVEALAWALHGDAVPAQSDRIVRIR